MDRTQTKSNPSIPDGKTPENMEAPINKQQNTSSALHTDSEQKSNINEASLSNRNMENYLGSEKMDEKLSTQTEKFQNDMRKSEKNIDDNNKINEKPDIDDSSK